MDKDNQSYLGIPQTIAEAQAELHKLAEQHGHALQIHEAGRLFTPITIQLLNRKPIECHVLTGWVPDHHDVETILIGYEAALVVDRNLSRVRVWRRLARRIWTICVLKKHNPHVAKAIESLRRDYRTFRAT